MDAPDLSKLILVLLIITNLPCLTERKGVDSFNGQMNHPPLYQLLSLVKDMHTAVAMQVVQAVVVVHRLELKFHRVIVRKRQCIK
jgi:hypothetical protein